jgi:hypothetical protein
MKRGVAGLVACAIGLGLAASGSGDAQPRSRAKLDDDTFWKLIVELSEPSGSYPDDNYVSNELELQRVLPDLERWFSPGGVYLGVGPEQNFSYVAARRPRIAFIVDIRRQNAMEHLMYKALFELADDRADFVSLLFSRQRPPDLDARATTATLFADFDGSPPDRALFEATLASIFRRLVDRHGFALSQADRESIAKVFTAFYEDGPKIRYIFRQGREWHPDYVQVMDMTDASGPNWSYLGSEERFQRVRRMQLANLIVPVVGDFAGPKTLRAIGAYVRGLGDTIDVFYASNVEQYLFADAVVGRFYDNVATLPLSDDAIFIRTFFGGAVLECGDARAPARTPYAEPIAELLADYRSGKLETRCALVRHTR